MFKRLAISRAAVATTFASISMFAQTAYADGTSYGHHAWGGGWGWGHSVFGPITMLAAFGLVVFLVIWAVRAFADGADRPSAGSRKRAAEDILRERFARGEIDKEEFEARRDVLGN